MPTHGAEDVKPAPRSVWLMRHCQDATAATGASSSSSLRLARPDLQRVTLLSRRACNNIVVVELLDGQLGPSETAEQLHQQFSAVRTDGGNGFRTKKGNTRMSNLFHLTWLALVGAVAVTGCTTSARKPDSGSAAAQPAGASASSQQPRAAPGMNERGEVVDSAKVESGNGTKVKGLGDWEGEITGKPEPGSKFTRLQIGMSMRQATDLVGQPTDQGAYMTGRAWIPFYFGSDRHRFEMVFKGHGRLIFAGGSLGDFTGGNLIWIIHNAKEGGYR